MSTLRLSPFAPLIFAVGCGSGGGTGVDATTDTGEPQGTREYYGSKQPGDVVYVTIDDEKMILDNQTLDQTIEITLGDSVGGFDAGTYDVDGSTGTALYVEMAGQGVLALGAYEDAVIAGAAVGACPTEDELHYNYMFTLTCQFVPETDSATAVLDLTKAGDTYDIHMTTYSLTGEEVEAYDLPGATCIDGVITVPGTEFTFGVTPEGFLIGDHGPNAGSGAGFPVPNQAPTVADVTGVDLLRGFLSKTIADEEEGVDGPVATIPVEGEGDGSKLDGYSIDAFGNGDRDGPYPFSFDENALPNLPGMLGGTFIGRDFVFMTGTVDGRRLIYGTTWELAGPEEVPEGVDITDCTPGVDPDEPSREVYINPTTLFLVEP